MRLTALTLTLLLLFTSVGAAPSDPINRSVVGLVNENGLTFCSGFVIHPEYVMTADHCLAVVQGFIRIDGVIAPEEVWHGGEKWDVAIVKLGAPTKRPPLKAAASIEGRDFKAYGFPGGKNELLVVELRSVLPWIRLGVGDDDVYWFLYKPDVKAGMSGGPIVDVNGEVVGIGQIANDIEALSMSRVMSHIFEMTKEFWILK